MHVDNMTTPSALAALNDNLTDDESVDAAISELQDEYIRRKTMLYSVRFAVKKLAYSVSSEFSALKVKPTALRFKPVPNDVETLRSMIANINLELRNARARINDFSVALNDIIF